MEKSVLDVFLNHTITSMFNEVSCIYILQSLSKEGKTLSDHQFTTDLIQTNNLAVPPLPALTPNHHPTICTILSLIGAIDRNPSTLPYLINLTLLAMISSTPKAFLSTMVRPCRLRAPSHTRISTVKQHARFQQARPGVPAYRQFSQTLSFALPRKDSQDKDSINTEATEYSKSATDDEGAKQEEAAFNPDITDPQEQKDKAGEGTGEGTVSNSGPRGRLQALRKLLTSFHILNVLAVQD